MVRVRFYFDASGAPHIWRHGVTEEEVEAVLLSPDEDRPAKNGARAAIGRTRAGRVLRVLYVNDPEPDSVFVLTAYALQGKALKSYRRRKQKKS